MDDVDPIVPAHLQPALGEAAESELVMAVELWGSDDPAERKALRDRIVHAVRVIDLLEARSCSGEKIRELACRAADDQDPERWPRTMAEADELIARASLARDLIQLRDTLGGRPPG